MSALDTIIEKQSEPYRKLIELAAEVPEIIEKSAHYIIAEIGADMSVFHSSKHLCSWAGLTPQNNESVEKRRVSGFQEQVST